jgi:poly(A) polymerase
MSDAPRMPHLVEEGTLARELGERFERAGHEAWLVGGTVRDRLLGRPAPHLDIATSAKPTDVLEIVRPWTPTVWLQGVRFGTGGASI